MTVWLSGFSRDTLTREVSLKGRRSSTVDLLLLTSLDYLLFILKILSIFFYKTSFLNEEVNCTAPSLLVSIPWLDMSAGIKRKDLWNNEKDSELVHPSRIEFLQNFKVRLRKRFRIQNIASGVNMFRPLWHKLFNRWNVPFQVKFRYFYKFLGLQLHLDQSTILLLTLGHLHVCF